MRHRKPSAPSAVPAPQNQLGEFLRAKRDQLRPQDLGLPAGLRRRAPGLRREEVAALCHISPTWYTWIEQGRTQAVSTETLGALATGLHLSHAERAYLFELAARADPDHPALADAATHHLDDLVKVIRAPAYILDRHWDAIAWNKPATALFEDWLKVRVAPAASTGRVGRNLLRYVFLHPQAPSFIVNWPERAQRLVAEFRSDTAAWRDDPVRQALVDELRSASRAFDVAWRSQKVLSREGGLRAFEHGRSGRHEYEQFTLRVAQHPDLKLTMLVPVSPA